MRSFLRCFRFLTCTTALAAVSLSCGAEKDTDPVRQETPGGYYVSALASENPCAALMDGKCASRTQVAAWCEEASNATTMPTAYELMCRGGSINPNQIPAATAICKVNVVTSTEVAEPGAANEESGTIACTHIATASDLTITNRDVNPDDDFLTAYTGEFEASNLYWMHERNTMLSDDTYEGHWYTMPGSITVPVRQTDWTGAITATGGPKRALVVRVIANGIAPKPTVDDLSTWVFQHTSKQLNACSYNEVSLKKTNELPSTEALKFERDATGAFTGVATFTTPKPAASYADLNEFALKVEEAVERSLGKRVTSVTDLLILCLPPGNPSKKAGMGYLADYLSAYQDEWCTSQSALLHYLGHNFGVFHAYRATTAVQDYSNAMGRLDQPLDKTAHCYSGAHTWMLGWRKKNRRYLDGKTNVTLPLLAPAPKPATGTTLVQFGGDLYVEYNAARDFNKDTDECRDAVVVTQRRATDKYHSFRLACLKKNENYTARDGRKITVESISAALASVKFNNGGADNGPILTEAAAFDPSYMGCYKDNANSRSLNALPPLTASNMTVAMCQKYCGNKGYDFAGLQGGKTCYCGTKFDRLGQATNCDTDCAGNFQQKCGGDLANSVYRAAGYEGCFTRNTTDTTFTFNQAMATGQVKVETCRSGCKSRKFSYAALFNGSQCRCGNREATTSEGTCDKRCTNNAEQNCGGSSSIAVWTAK